MPNFSDDMYNSANADYELGFIQPEPGAYVLKVMDVRTEWTEREFSTGLNRDYNSAYDAAVIFVYDIAEGPHAGYYSDDFYYANGELDPRKDFMHQYKFVWGDLAGSEKDRNRAKNVLEAFSGSNQGFDALMAFRADNWRLFIGKRFGAVLNGTVKTNDRGYDNWSLRPSTKLYTVDAIHAGATANGKPLPEPRITDKRSKPNDGAESSTSGQAGAAETYDDIPF